MPVPVRRPSSIMRPGMTRDLPPRQSVAIMIDQYVFVDKKKSTPGSKEFPNGDYAEGFLLHDVDVMGLKAEYVAGETEESAPVPTTRVKIAMPKPADGKGERRRDLFGLSKPKGGGEAMDPGSVVIFQKAWFDKKTGTIKAHYSKGAASKNKLDGELKTVFSDMLVSVRPEGKNAKGPGPAGRVDVLIADPKAAMVLTSKEEFQNEVLGLVANSAIGNPGFQMLARQLAPEGTDPVEFASDPNTRVGVLATARRSMYIEQDGVMVPKPEDVSKDDARVQWRLESGEQLLARFTKDNAEMVDLIGDPGWQIEFMPMMAVNQAKSMVPSEAEKAGDTVRDISKIYGIYGEVPPGRDGEGALDVATAADGRKFGMVDVGWTLSHVVCERQARDSDIWYSTFQSPMGEKQDIDSGHDVRTPLTPDYHVTAIKATAAASLEGKIAHRAAAKTPEEAPEEIPEEAPQAGPAPR